MRYPENHKTQTNQNINREAEKAFIRFLHALPTNPPFNIDVVINDKTIVRNLKYQDFTNYLTLAPGNYEITLYPAGSRTRKLLTSSIAISNDEILTVAITGTINEIEIESFSDYLREIDNTSAHMRFINLTAERTPVDVYVDNNPIVYELQYTEETNFISFAPGKHTMEIKLSDSGRTVVYHPNMLLKVGNYYTSFVVGRVSQPPTIEVLIPLEGVSYLK